VLHIAATGEDFGYYQDYADDHGKVGKALAEGFVFQGEHMPYRGGTRGKPSKDLPPTAFISFIQNHDQIGNRARGDRMVTYRPMEPDQGSDCSLSAVAANPDAVHGRRVGRARAVSIFLRLRRRLNEKVRKGRREELSRLPGFDADDLLDPTAQSTFEKAKLDWSQLSGPASEMLVFYRSLLALRHQRIVPLLKGTGSGSGSFRRDGKRDCGRLDACARCQASPRCEPFGRISEVRIAARGRSNFFTGFCQRGYSGSLVDHFQGIRP
jgi:1,4-alpha-glucan branching enzyme